MIRKAIALAPLFLALACGGARMRSPTPQKQPLTQTKPAKEKKEEKPEESLVETRKVGDYFVYRYSGSYTPEPITLTEQVVAEEFGLYVVDYVLEQKEQMTALRVRVQPSGKIVSVSKMGAEGELHASIADYEALMARTQFVPDSNDRTVSTEKSTCLVGKDEVDCETTTYAVRIGDKEGLLSVSKSAAGKGRDVGGELLGADGTSIYRAELVEAGHEEAKTNALVWAGKSLRAKPEE